ncbi:topoisomerase-4 subunit A [Entomoplasma freundtii]|uniref:DNA topoisomerase 4 subunit A n=1 Tax=Entomoplasma freundtii TaxID=74700 RepID=A0A2K8NUM2_9MOLU|nr:DNA topoisomerase IV subunit A [Entomoplasma freundtii]ATZ16323.1 DNA topoisomerase IV subunit A [Entomoplasma freundtii]TDY56638.1 topoisomerase-4 subunit A [Entomoplasma freundtii]
MTKEKANKATSSEANSSLFGSEEPSIITSLVEDIMGDRFGRYAKYIIQDRALPDVRDGLKPVQRRILYAMDSLGLTADKPPKKSARVVGEVIGKYHPHGDSSVYEALVRMSQSWKLGLPLVDMQGNNGSIDGDSAAAMRYTEVRLASIANLMLEDLGKETVKFAPNFDDSEQEPTVLPSYFPNILANGAAGIAAGYATNMPPHNLGELIDATIKVIDSPKTRLESILNIVQGPDFPTGGVVQGRDGIREAFLTGRGKVVLNSRWHFESNDLVIDEIPYEVVKQDLVKKIGDVIDANPGLGIEDVRDETDRQGLRIVIELDAKANGEVVRKFLFKNTLLSVSYNYNNVVIVDKQPKLLGLLPILHAYINHYREVLTRKSEFDYKKAKKRLEIVRGLIKMVSVIDHVIKIIRHSENRALAIENLVHAHFNFTTLQATAIVDMRLHRLTSTDVVKLELEEKALEEELKHLRSILKNPLEMNKEMTSRLRKVKRDFPTPRRTTIHEFEESLEVQIKDTLVERKFSLWVSRDGYLKAIDACVIEKNDPNTFGRKPMDLWISYGRVSNLDNLLLVTNKGSYYSVPLYKVPMSKWKDLGVHLNTLATTSGPEKILGAFVVDDFAKATQQLLLATMNGQIKRTAISNLETKVFTKSFKVIKMDPKDELVSVDLVTSKTRNVVIGTKNGYGVTYDVEDIPIQGTAAKGVKAANLKNDTIVFACPLDTTDEIIFFTSQNRVKKITATALPTAIRPKKGLRLYPERPKNPEAIKLGFALKEYEQVILLDDQNQVTIYKMTEAKLSELTNQPKALVLPPIVDGAYQKLQTSIDGDQPAPSLPIMDEPKHKETTSGVKKTPSKTTKVAKRPITNADDLSSLLTDISDVLTKPKISKATSKTSKKTTKSRNVAKQLDFDKDLKVK